MMTRFQQRLTPELMQEVNDISSDERKLRKSAKIPLTTIRLHRPMLTGIVGKKVPARGSKWEPANEGTLILDATYVPQNIRFPTDVPLLNEARENSEEIIDAFHKAGLTDGKKPRTYRKNVKKNTTVSRNLKRKRKRASERSKRSS